MDNKDPIIAVPMHLHHSQTKTAIRVLPSWRWREPSLSAMASSCACQVLSLYIRCVAWSSHLRVGHMYDYLYIPLFSLLFKRNSMNLRDADSGKILWQSNDDLYVTSTASSFPLLSHRILCCSLPSFLSCTIIFAYLSIIFHGWPIPLQDLHRTSFMMV